VYPDLFEKLEDCVPGVCIFIHHVRSMSCAVSYFAQDEQKSNQVNFHHAKIAFKCMLCQQAIKLEYGSGAL